MRRPVKWALIGIGSIVAIVAGVAGYIAATFDPNDYKADIIRAFKEKTGRTLQLPGSMGLTFYPTLGMKLGEASLSEPNSAREFARVADATVAVKLMPLLSKEVIVDALEVKGLRATIARDKAGRYNFNDLASTEQKKPEEKTAAPLKVDIDHITVSDGDVTYVDQSTGAQYRLSKLNVRTGRVANGVSTPLDFSALIASPKDKAQLDTHLKAKLTYDLERKLYRLEGLDFSTKGNFDTFTALNATAKGDLEIRSATGELIAKNLAAAISGKQSGGDLKAKIDVPSLTLTTEKVAGGKLALEFTRESYGSKLQVKATTGSVQGAFKAMNAGPLDVQIETQGERTVKAHLTGRLNANLENKRFEIPDLKIDAKINDPKFPKGALDAALTGSARADLTKASAALDFAGRLGESKVSGKAAVTKFAPLALTFDLDADELDADRLMGKTPGTKTQAKSTSGDAARVKDEKIDLSALHGLNAAGTVRIGKLTLLNLKSAQVRADLKVANGRLDIAPLSAQLYQGTLKGSLSAQAAENPLFDVKQALSGVALGPLLRDAANIDTLEAKGTINVDLTTRGPTVAALKKALNGTATVHLADGAIKGIDIAGSIRGARDKLRQLRGEQVQPSNKQLRTDFSELTATFDVKNGVAHNNDLAMKSPLLRVSGAGDIDIGNDRLNYLLKATVVASSKGQGGKELSELNGLTVPVKLTGTLDSPQYSIDFGGMAMDFAKQQLQDELLRRATGGKPGDDAKASKGGGKVQDVIKDSLKGILGR